MKTFYIHILTFFFKKKALKNSAYRVRTEYLIQAKIKKKKN